VLGDGTTAPAVCRLTKNFSSNRNPSWVPAT
jgi:hypothetical protein